jgi:hypothetical protein
MRDCTVNISQLPAATPIVVTTVNKLRAEHVLLYSIPRVS